jgi:hypothetical protein
MWKQKESARIRIHTRSILDPQHVLTSRKWMFRYQCFRIRMGWGSPWERFKFSVGGCIRMGRWRPLEWLDKSYSSLIKKLSLEEKLVERDAEIATLRMDSHETKTKLTCVQKRRVCLRTEPGSADDVQTTSWHGAQRNLQPRHQTPTSSGWTSTLGPSCRG